MLRLPFRGEHGAAGAKDAAKESSLPGERPREHQRRDQGNSATGATIATIVCMNAGTWQGSRRGQMGTTSRACSAVQCNPLHTGRYTYLVSSLGKTLQSPITFAAMIAPNPRIAAAMMAVSVGLRPSCAQALA